MNSRQLKDLLGQIEALKTSESSPEFQAGVDAAYELVNKVAKRAIALERKEQLKAELAQLEAEYPENGATTGKRSGRKPKAAAPAEPEFEVVAGA